MVAYATYGMHVAVFYVGVKMRDLLKTAKIRRYVQDRYDAPARG